MVTDTAVDQAQAIAPHMPRRVLHAYLTEMVAAVGVRHVVRSCGCLTQMAQDYVRADSRRPCPSC